MKFPFYKWLEPEAYIDITPSEIIPIDPVLFEILTNRGFITAESISSFLKIYEYEPTSAMELPNIEASTQQLINAIKNESQIYIYGFSDIDAQSAVSILVAGLKEISKRATITYAQNTEWLYKDNSASSRNDLVILCGDCQKNHQFFTSRNLNQIIIGAQFTSEQLEYTTPVISPQWLPPSHPLKNLSTSGCALKLLGAVNQLCGKPIECNDYLDLAAIGTIASHNLLIGDNRYIITKGLDSIRSNPRLFIQAMYEVSNKKLENIHEDDIRYFLIPRLYIFVHQENNDHISDFILTDDRHYAHLTALKLEGNFSKNKLNIDQVLRSATQIVQNDSALLNKSIIILDNETWPIEALSEVSRKLVNKYQKPFILIAQEDIDNCIGYARTMEEFDLFNTLSNTEDIIQTLKFYQKSARFEIKSDNIEKFKKRIIFLCDDLPSDQASFKTVKIDKYITFDELTENLINSIRILEPYGPGNPRINFAAKDLKITKTSHFGHDNQHLKLRLGDHSGNTREMIMWDRDSNDLPDSEINIIFQIKANNIKSDDEFLYEIIDIDSSNKNENSNNRDRQVTIIDYRHHANPEVILNDLIREEEITIYAEGNINKKISNLRNRYELNKSNKVILWTVPPGKSELREIIKAVSPSYVYLFGNIGNDNNEKSMIYTLGAMINYAFENYNGYLSIPKLAAATNQRESTINLGIKYLEAMGKIKILETSLHKIKVEKGGSSDREHAKYILESLQKLLNETIAFQNYYLSNDSQSIIMN